MRLRDWLGALVHVREDGEGRHSNTSLSQPQLLMRRSLIIALPVACLALTVPSFGQGAAVARNADQAWTDLTAQKNTQGKGGKSVTAVAPASDRKARIAEQADDSAKLAQSARAFYQQYPNHPKAAEAKKIEVVAAIHGIKPENPAQERDAVGAATLFRRNQLNPLADRFEVALALDRYQHSQTLKSRRVQDATAEWVRLADNLKKEFGDLPALQEYYVSIARRAETSAATAIAGGPASTNDSNRR